MTELATVRAWPTVERPVLVVSMEGWIDAGLAAATAAAGLLGAMPHELVATFDPDELIDFRARRPTLRIDNGVDTELRWSAIRLHAATNRTGRTVLTLTGPEPDMRWHRFISEVVQLSSRLGVQLVIGLGAFPAPVPHTRSVQLIATSPSSELANRVGVMPASIEVPSGVQGALEVAFGEAGIPAIGLWARVPHYVSAMPYPAAAATLLEGLARLADLELDTSALREAATSSRQQIDQLIAGSEEHAALVHQLEAQQDREQGLAGNAFGNLPSGDELAAELERFLRGEH
jgi:proteasome assembly chaperone (PAC2) family protein